MKQSHQVQEAISQRGFADQDTDSISIVTLGNFDIQWRGESLLASCKRSYKILDLLRYFITFHDKRLPPETIIDDMWPDSSSADPRNLLRAQVYRLRKLLEEIQFVTADQKAASLKLTFSSGYYLFTMGEKCLLDTDIFEETVKHAESLLKDDRSAAIDLYKQALVLYKGQYMAGTVHTDWLIPFQNRYHRFYLQAVFRLLELLNSSNSYREIIEICELASLIEPYDETLHLYFMQALTGLGDIKGALSHYNYITSFLYKELGVKPSPVMRALYRKLQMAMQNNNNETDLVLIQQQLTDDDDMTEAMYCDIDYFRFLYQLEKRRSLRDKTMYDFVGLLTVSSLKAALTGSETEAIIEQLIQVLKKSLRKNDVFSRWNHNQILILLAALQRDNLIIITDRLYDHFHKTIRPDKVNIKMRFQPLFQERLF